ncbi:TetR-like C-terminal domain-containing protein [Cellulomonas sp. URHD0024]|uniref:TetR-like C-terminal domain-containing protein n=1 Tax=Cellulomonas sp. URHD0024 TaxID=1302620 RepID=UPI00040A001D|nr:TetR-like C-terminal domain-containing protein [Cellulomonas sp. URHD0024]
MPRAGLDHAAVVDLALRVVDDGGPTGYADLTLAAVAARAGVAVPSLYKHVDGLPGLRRDVALVCVREFADLMRTLDSLSAIGHATRAYARSTPGRYDAVQGTAWIHDPAADEVREASAAVVDDLARAVVALGVPAENRIDAVRAVRAAVHGFVVLELAGGFGMPEDVDASFSFLVDGLVSGLVRLSV